MPGTLVVVATPIGNLGDMSTRAAAALVNADVVLAEDTRHTGRLLSHVGSAAPQLSLHEHNERERVAEVLTRLADGATVALVSDAGTPLVSDPGHRVVVAAIQAGYRVEAVPGPSAVLAALVVAGLPTDRVAFEGFLPRKGSARTKRLEQLASEERTMVVFVAVHRAAADLADLAVHLGSDRRASMSRELTKLHEETVRGTLGELTAAFAEKSRGELTLVIQGAPEVTSSPDDADLVAAVARLTSRGMSTRDAVDAVADDRGVPRRRVYELAVGND